MTIFVLLIFAFFISDFRNKRGMTPLLNRRLIFFIKFFYLLPMLINVYVIINLENLFIYTHIGMILTIIGTFMVIKAKGDLGKYHTWAGHILSKTRIMTKGVYSFVRHPLYIGIFIFMNGAILIGTNNNSFTFYSIVLIMMFVFFIIGFLIISARKESKFLHEKFGEDFIEYKKQVHAFLPIRKYSCDKL